MNMHTRFDRLDRDLSLLKAMVALVLPGLAFLLLKSTGLVD